MLTEIVINIFRIIDMFLKRNLAESLFAFTDDHLLFHFKKKKEEETLWCNDIIFKFICLRTCEKIYFCWTINIFESTTI